MNNKYDKLIEAAEYTAALLSKIPAFGKSIGSEVNKPLLGVARNKLLSALAEIHIKEPEPNIDELVRILTDTTTPTTTTTKTKG